MSLAVLSTALGARPRLGAFVFIFVTVLLDVLALGLIIPVLPKLVMGMLGGDSQVAARVLGLFGFTWAAMQFIFSPILGALSDRFGRRPVILFSNFGLGLNYLLAVAAPSVQWLLVTRVISGIASASMTTAGAYIADVTPPEERAATFGLLGAAFGIGFVVGPSLGGILGGIDTHLPFWVAGGLSLANGLYGLFVLPESLPSDKRTPFHWGKANAWGSLTLLRSQPQLTGLALVSFLVNLAHEVWPATFVLFADYRFKWSVTTIGLTLGAMGVGMAVVQGLLVRPFVRQQGERRALYVGLALGAIGFAGFGLAPSGAWFWASIPIMSFLGLAGAAVQGIMTRRVAVTEQGRLQGALGSLRSFGGLIGPFLYTSVFAAAIARPDGIDVPGAAFLLASVLLMIGGVLAYRVTPRAPSPSGEGVAP